MEYIANLYGMILNLIRSILVAFGADTEVVDGLINDLKNAQEETPEA